MSRAFKTSLWSRAIAPLVAGIARVARDGPANRHTEPKVTATAERQNGNGPPAASTLLPSDVSRLDCAHNIPPPHIRTKTPRITRISLQLGLDAASIKVSNSANDWHDQYVHKRHIAQKVPPACNPCINRVRIVTCEVLRVRFRPRVVS